MGLEEGVGVGLGVPCRVVGGGEGLAVGDGKGDCVVAIVGETVRRAWEISGRSWSTSFLALVAARNWSDLV